MRKRTQRPLELESMESLILLSGITAAANSPAITTSLNLPFPPIIAISGKTTGTYTVEQKLPDIGKTYEVTTHGTLSGLGKATVTGSLHTLGNIASGHASGTLVVKVNGGTLTLTLTGPNQHGFDPLPSMFSYAITGATGKFHSKIGTPIGKGTVDVSITPNPTNSMSGGSGKITLSFHPSVVTVA